MHQIRMNTRKILRSSNLEVHIIFLIIHSPQLIWKTTLNCVDTQIPEVITLEEDNTNRVSAEDTDSIFCRVEEDDLSCPQEEMLDLTVTDEFDDEVGRCE